MGKVQLVNPAGGFDEPYRAEAGGNPFPFTLSKNVAYPDAGVFTTFNHDTKVPYVQQWNFGIQRQVGTNWLVSASYIGNEIVHLYGSSELNPAIYFPGNANASGQCFAEGYTFQTTANAVCSTTANTNNRRIATLVNPTEGRKFSNVGLWDDGGTRSYNAFLINTEKRLSEGFSFTANYTWSHCTGTAIGSGTLLQSSAGNDPHANRRSRQLHCAGVGHPAPVERYGNHSRAEILQHLAQCSRQQLAALRHFQSRFRKRIHRGQRHGSGAEREKRSDAVRRSSF
jgi:hypothetical protein